MTAIMKGANSFVTRLEQDLERCLDSLAERLQVERIQANTHQLLVIRGIDCSPECLCPLAVYCVGQIARAVQVNLTIKADLLGIDATDADARLAQDVHSIIGECNESLSGAQRRDDRNPWLFEALSHLFVNLSVKRPELLSVGRLIGLSMTHGSAKEQGLDLVAIYAHDTVGLAIGESKVWKDNPSGALRDAAKMFVEVDLGRRDHELRKTVGLMRYAMPKKYQRQISKAFWKHERAYMPFVCYDSNQSPRWHESRQALGCLQVPSTHRILTPLSIQDSPDFFDSLADAMRNYLDAVGAT